MSSVHSEGRASVWTILVVHVIALKVLYSSTFSAMLIAWACKSVCLLESGLQPLFRFIPTLSVVLGKKTLSLFYLKPALPIEYTSGTEPGCLMPQPDEHIACHQHPDNRALLHQQWKSSMALCQAYVIPYPRGCKLDQELMMCKNLMRKNIVWCLSVMNWCQWLCCTPVTTTLIADLAVC